MKSTKIIAEQTSEMGATLVSLFKVLYSDIQFKCFQFVSSSFILRKFKLIPHGCAKYFNVMTSLMLWCYDVTVLVKTYISSAFGFVTYIVKILLNPKTHYAIDKVLLMLVIL